MVDLFTKLPPPPGLKGGGIGNAIIGTLMTVGIGTLISLPFGVFGCGLFIRVQFTVKHLAGFALQQTYLAGVPSIIAGIFAYGIIVVNDGRILGSCGWCGTGGADVADDCPNY
jgi:phosphate transport system permease protein